MKCVVVTFTDSMRRRHCRVFRIEYETYHEAAELIWKTLPADADYVKFYWDMEIQHLNDARFSDVNQKNV